MDLAPLLLLIFFVLAIGSLAYGIVHEEMYGERVEQMIGEFTGKEHWLTKMTLKVHLLRREDSEKLIGIELIEKTFASYAKMPMTFSLSQGQLLASLLQSATRTQVGIEQTIGVITVEKQRLTVGLFCEHKETLISIALNGRFLDGDGISPIALTVIQAQQLASLLESATRTHQAT